MLRAALFVTATIFLSGCGLVSGGADSVRDVIPCPVYPDEKVAEELEDFSFEGHEDFWQWMDRTEKLNDALATTADDCP